jgi:hypothetical protein
MLSHAARVRFVADTRRSGNAAAAGTTRPCLAVARSFARSLVASLASIAFALTTK